ncbi:vitamin B6 photo-protection and homoeostasis-domain-containing protein [Cytidiella melzeri]|nr:vitamin B6 photo-protection and homoeostasis-domain-containing protein [Cytidiella melzeri]
METTEFILREKDESGKENAVYIVRRDGVKPQTNITQSSSKQRISATRILRAIFLPAGFPNSVSDDYLRYQILNACQAFCSSLAGLLASRAILEGHGVGKADASATDALLLTILQDVFSRLCTIISAYYLGTSLYPEAKTYRLLADILNDAALVLDSLSPHLSSLTLYLLRTPQFPFLSLTFAHRPGPFRAVALCTSGILRAICGVVAGGSKAALTLHFAQPASGKGTGDVGDLSAKDGSKETVLALFGMLCGSALMPYITGARATYGLLAILVTAHVLLNYYAVRGVVLRSLNRQRTGLLWSAYRRGTAFSKAATPLQIARQEHIFARPSSLYQSTPGTDASTGSQTVGKCHVGSSLLGTLDIRKPDIVFTLIDIFAEENYIVWFDHKAQTNLVVTMHIMLKDGHAVEDHLKAWILATELASLCGTPVRRERTSTELMNALLDAKHTVNELFPEFLDKMHEAGWDLTAAAGGFVTGIPTTIHIESGEAKKTR